MASKLDIVVFGATGFTGKFVLVQVSKLAKGLSWGVAGRNETKLVEALNETAKVIGVDHLNNIRTIVADVESEHSIKNMTAQAKVIINCCGPYSLYGEVVVKSCIESGTHYVDVTGETYFINEMLHKYTQLAENKGVYIVSACAFISIPADIGMCYIENNFPGTINSVEIYRYNEGDNMNGLTINYGTWASAIYDFSNFRKVKKVLTGDKLPALKPKLSSKLIHKVDKGWAFPFPSVDDSIVQRSQAFFHKNNSKRPIQMCSYAVMPSLIFIIVAFIAILFEFVLAQFKFGRNLLLKYPEFFTNGICSRLESVEKVDHVRFSVVLKCYGWNDKLSEGQDNYTAKPNKEIVGRISGTNPGYGFTATAVTLCALMFLTEQNNLPAKGGVYTPAIAFSKTSLVQQLQKNGVVFEVLSIKDI